MLCDSALGPFARESCGLWDLVGFGGLVLEEAEGGIALAEDTCLE